MNKTLTSPNHSLQHGLQIAVSWTMNGFARVLPISSSTSRRVLIVFSGYARQKLVTGEQASTSNLLVNGGTPRALKLVLDRMTTWYNEGKIVQFKTSYEMGFIAVWQVYKMAFILDIPSLQAQIVLCLTRICCGEVHFQDCREVFTSTDPEKLNFQGMVAQSIAKAIFNNRLRHKTEFPCFMQKSLPSMMQSQRCLTLCSMLGTRLG